MSIKDEIRKASGQFYAALNRVVNGDASQMIDIWSHSSTVTTMHHPIGGREVGWDEVRKSFEQVAKLASGGKFELKNQLIQVAGDVAYELGVEHGQAKLAGQQANIEYRVTNIYQRETEAWKIIHHHTDVSSERVAILKGLQANE